MILYEPIIQKKRIYCQIDSFNIEDNNIIGIKKDDGGIIDISNNFKDSLKYKHMDLELYGKRIFNKEELIIPSNVDSIIKSISLLKDKFISKENVIHRIKYLNNEFIDFNKISDNEINQEYLLFNKEELDSLLDNCINYVEKEIAKII